MKYSYMIIKENNPYNKQESTLLDNKYKNTKYAMFEKMINKDSSESLVSIRYSNDLQKLHEIASKFISWYNYPMNIKKNMQGFLSYINN